MARYTGPNCRLCRRIGEKLMLKGARCYTPKCSFEKRAKPSRRGIPQTRRMSEWGLQLRGKQKVRYSYGVLERQFKSTFKEAERMPGITGENLLELLERRLDNVVYRLCFADSRAQARQLVRHGHISLNGHKTDIPSCIVDLGDVIAWREASTKTEYYQNMVSKTEDRPIPGWLSLDHQSMTGRVMALPTRDDIDTRFDGKVIVEYYSR